ncbi:ROK family protein [Planococcus sp. APC 4015]|nr:ROK family protein [Planococcus sp. APC 4015]
MSQTISPTAVRRMSLGGVLSYAWDAEVFTASDAMASVGLTRSTMIDVIEELVEAGLLDELENARAVGGYRKGRPARRFRLRADAAVVVGIDLAPDHIVTAVTDLRGEVIVRHSSHTDLAHDSPRERREAAASAVDDALHAAGRTRADVLALCAGVPAPVDAHGASPAHRNGFWRRMNPDLAEMFGAWAPLVRIVNDAALAAVAEESVGAARGVSDHVTVLCGRFLGAGVVVDGNLLRGAHGGVAEMVAFDHVAGVEDASGLGERVAQWARAAVETGAVSPGGTLTRLNPSEITAELVFRLAREADPDAAEIVERAGRALSIITAVLGSLFDPRRVVVSGMDATEAAQLVAAARGSVPLELDLPAPELVASELGPDVICIGAVSAALDAARAGVLDLGDDERPLSLRRAG